MRTELTIGDLEVILSAFNYSKQAIGNYQYQGISSQDAYKLRTQRLSEIESVEAKIRSIKQKLL